MTKQLHLLGHQQPTNGVAPSDFSALLSIATHPAVRIGFLDAQKGQPLDHDHILERIARETPATALRRIGWDRTLGRLDQQDWLLSATGSKLVEIAQYRYEEGRRLVCEMGLKCKAWGHPDYPPAQVINQLRTWSQQRQRKVAA